MTHQIAVGPNSWGGAGSREAFLGNRLLALFEIDGVARFASIPEPAPEEIAYPLDEQTTCLLRLIGAQRSNVYGMRLYELRERSYKKYPPPSLALDEQ